MARRSLPLVAVTAAAVLALGCSRTDGRTLPPADPSRTTTSVSAPVVGQPSDTQVAEVFTVLSAAFVEGGAIPEEHTCRGAGASPPLSWASTPPAAELALVVRDRSAAGFVHWVVTSIDPLVQGFGAGGLPESAVEATNGAGTLGWYPPCPPPGTGAHTYEVALHALPEPLALAPGTPAEEAAQLVEGASSERAALSGTVIG
jgi:phosphatidylethanolamine-binding protein (PEBP) family uncharacterized protein